VYRARLDIGRERSNIFRFDEHDFHHAWRTEMRYLHTMLRVRDLDAALNSIATRWG